MKTTSRISILLSAIIVIVSHQVALAQDHAAKVQEVLTLAHKYGRFNGSAKRASMKWRAFSTARARPFSPNVS